LPVPVFTGFVPIILQACGLAGEYQSHAAPRVGAAPRSSSLILFVDEVLAEPATLPSRKNASGK
jgi:hypothetical protein